MRSRLILAGDALRALARLAAAQDARTAIAAASKAMGADTLNTIEYSGSGADFTLGQALQRHLAVAEVHRQDLHTPVDFRVAGFEDGSHPDAGRKSAARRRAAAGLGEQPQNQTIVVNANTPWVQQLEIWMLPHGFLRAAAANNATVEDADRRRQEVHRGVLHWAEQGDGQRLHQRSEPGRARRDLIDNPVLGDTQFEAVYTDYKDFGGVKFPMHIVQRQGGYPDPRSDESAM